MADDGYLIGFEDSNGNFVEVGRFNNAGTSVTQPIELVHSSSGKKISIDSTGVSTSDLSVGGVDFADKADLNSTGVLKSTQVPNLSITSVDVVADQTARLNLAAQEGDVAIQTDINETFVLSTNDPTVDSNWKKVQLDVVGAIDGQTITPGQVGTSSSRSNIFADDVGARSIASDYLYAGEFSGSDPDARLDNCLSAASTGDVIYLESATYTNSRTISKRVQLIGTNRNVGTEFLNGLTMSQFHSEIRNVQVEDGLELQDGTIAMNITSGGGIQVPGSEVLVMQTFRSNVTLQSSSSNCIVDHIISGTVTDNGSGNSVGQTT
jgi:hypothetical protein